VTSRRPFLTLSVHSVRTYSCKHPQSLSFVRRKAPTMRFRTRRWPSGCLSHALPWHVSVKNSRFWLYDSLPACPDRRNIAEKNSGEMLYPPSFLSNMTTSKFTHFSLSVSSNVCPVCTCVPCSRRLRGTLLKLYIPPCTASWSCEAELKTFFYCLILVSGSINQFLKSCLDFAPRRPCIPLVSLHLGCSFSLY